MSQDSAAGSPVTRRRCERNRQTIPVARSIGRCPTLHSDRREFLQEVGGGKLAVLIGSGLAAELGLAAEDNKDDKDNRTISF